MSRRRAGRDEFGGHERPGLVLVEHREQMPVELLSLIRPVQRA
jgi:hypothetical protein